MDAKNNPTTVDEYIAQFPEDIQQILFQIRAVIKDAAPGAVEKISYQMPGYSLKRGLVWFAAYKNHIGFYPTATGIAAFKDDLAGYKFSKGAVQFQLDAPIPFDLITKIVKFKVAENQGKK